MAIVPVQNLPVILGPVTDQAPPYCLIAELASAVQPPSSPLEGRELLKGRPTQHQRRKDADIRYAKFTQHHLSRTGGF